MLRHKNAYEENHLSTDQLLQQVSQILQDYPNLTKVADQALKKLLDDLQSKDNKLELKKIADLQGEFFFVDNYQRGYKWTPDQVSALLNDIDEFQPNPEISTDFYCLQPVVVKHRILNQDDTPISYWELIDGQQRMTTIFIIFSYLTHTPFFNIRYETREKSSAFLHQLYQLKSDQDINEDELSIDDDYFLKAYQAVEKWFNKKQEGCFDLEAWKTKFLHQTQVIWYQVHPLLNEDSRQQSIAIFTRLNQGKIALTDAELIKALFLQQVTKVYSSPDLALQKQLEMANQWDLIEQNLQNDEFWKFLSPQDYQHKYTRIELILDLIAKDAPTSAHDLSQHRTFFYYAEKFKDDAISNDQLQQQLEKDWQSIVMVFQRLIEWYQEDRLYHLIGFLIKYNYKNIYQLWQISKHCKRDEFEGKLRGLVYEVLHKIFYVKENKNLDFEILRYDDGSAAKAKIRALLMLFNIYRHEQNNTRLSFKQYDAVDWDIEHIHARNSQELTTADAHQVWLEEQNLIIKSLTGTHQVELQQKLNEYLSADTAQKSTYRDAYEKLLNDIVGDASEGIHTLDNLCLLPEEVNRSIGNDLFFIKRQDIRNREKKWEEQRKEQRLQGKVKQVNFIPLASQQVFSKYFSVDVTQMLAWQASDRNAYKNALIECFEQYGIKFNHTDQE